jgi:hypothetical protein
MLKPKFALGTRIREGEGVKRVRIVTRLKGGSETAGNQSDG